MSKKFYLYTYTLDDIMDVEEHIFSSKKERTIYKKGLVKGGNPPFWVSTQKDILTEISDIVTTTSFSKEELENHYENNLDKYIESQISENTELIISKKLYLKLIKKIKQNMYWE